MEDFFMNHYLPVRDANNPHNVTLYPVSEEVYHDISKEINRTRSKMQYHGQCACPKKYLWKCDGDCSLCEYRSAGDKLSLDKEIEMHGDTFADTADVEEIVSDEILMKQLLARLAELMPEAVEVGKLIESGLSERTSLEQLDLKRSTYRSQLAKVRKILEAEFGKIF